MARNFLIAFLILVLECSGYLRSLQKRQLGFNSTLFVKKKGKRKQGNGFGEKNIIPVEKVIDATISEVDTEITTPISIPEKAKESDFEAIINKYNIGKGETTAPYMTAREREIMTKKKALKNVPMEDQPFGFSTISKIDPKQQQKLDNVLLTGAFGSLAFVVLCGIGISLGAFNIVFKDFELSPEIDSLIKNILDPAFTPALGVFFFFSITYGLFKFAQLSSEQTVYREP